MIRRTTTRLEGIAQPEVSPYGILSPAATVVLEASDHWLAGFTYDTVDDRLTTVNQVIYGGPSTATSVVTEAVDGSPSTRTYYPFDIKASVKVSTFGTNLAEVQQSADTALQVVTQKAIEKEFWTGELAKQLTVEDHGNRYLSHSSAVDVTPSAGTPVKIKYGQALLEQAIGNATIGAKGTIHAPLLIASNLQASDKDGALTTNLGTKVITGPGYSSVGPNGVVAPTGSAWMYATGPVTVIIGRSPVVTPELLSQAVDIGNNTAEFYVDRPAAVVWSTSYLYAVLVDLTLDYQ